MSGTGTSEKLKESIEQLYRVFSDHRPRPDPDGCRCCVTKQDMLRLSSKPLRKLTAEDLGRFSESALLTWGTVEDFKWFLPRMLELITTSASYDLTPETLLGKLRLAGWQSWGKEERAALRAYFDSAWWHCLVTCTDGWRPHSFLCGLGRAVDDLTPYLGMWTRCRLRSGYECMADVIDRNAPIMVKRSRLVNGFWSEAEPQMGQVIRWLAGAATLEELEQIYFAQPEAPFSDALSRAANKMAVLQATLRSLDQ